MKHVILCKKESVIPRVYSVQEQNITGLYGWMNIFESEILSFSDMTKHDLEYYDVIHVNMITGHATLPSEIREKLGWDSDTQLIANVDYAVDMWPFFFSHPQAHLGHFTDSLRDCDMVFVQETHQKEYVETLTGQQAFLVPHPCSTTYIKPFVRPSHERLQEIGVMYHKCDKPSLFWTNLILINQFPQYKKVLYAYKKPKHGRVEYGKFDKVLKPLQFPDFLERLSASYVALDCYNMHVAGRFVMECAVLGIPCVASTSINAAHRLFPDLAVDTYNIQATQGKLKKVLNNPAFYQQVSDHAQEAVEWYNYKQSKQRFMEALQEAYHGSHGNKRKTSRREAKVGTST